MVFNSPFLPGGTSLSSFTREGNWLITLNNARTEDLLNYVYYKSGINIEISVQAPEGNAKIQTKNQNLVQDIILGDLPNSINLNKPTLAGFAAALGSKRGSINYNEIYDINNDGNINVLDWSSLIVKNKAK